MSKKMTGKVVWTVVLLGGLAFLWFKGVPPAYWVAQEREVLLGRYSVGQAAALIILTPLGLLVLWGIWTAKEKTREQKRQDAFKTIAVILSVLAGIILCDIALRVVQRSQYFRAGHSYHRQPNQVRRGIFEDRPACAFTYPNAPDGYPPVSYTFTTDARGFRNQTDLDRYDILVLGDSFAEGSGVSDEQVWGVRLAASTGCTVYNLGMSGTSAEGYLDVLRQTGLSLKPKVVLCMLYEGNDFRDSNFGKTDANGTRHSLKDVLFRGSPLRKRIQTVLVDTLGPVFAGRFDGDPSALTDPKHPMYPVAWQPMELPSGSGNYYAFEVKRLLDHCVDPLQFAQTRACRRTQEVLSRLKALCADHQIRLVVVYAPDKPHVLLEAGKDSLCPAQVRAFMALKRKNPPPADQLWETILPQMDTYETVMRQFCEKEEIEFISLTGVLRRQMQAGRRAYFTYDQHWSPEGHQIVAEFLAGKISL
jgi:hypothetical protein